MFQRFDEECRKVLKQAKLEMQNLKHPFVGSEHLILSILKFSNINITIKLKELDITYEKYKKELIKMIGIGNSLNSYFIYTPMLKRIIENAILDAKDKNLLEVNVETLFLTILDEGEGVGVRVLNRLGLNIDELYMDLVNKDIGHTRYKTKKKLSIYDYGIDLVEKASLGKIDPVIGREKEINRLIEILVRRNKNNPLLIGEAGVGKTAIVEALALMIYQKEVPEILRDKKIISISIASLVAGTKYRGEFEDRINKMIKEIESNDNLILFVDEIHSIVGAGGAEGAIDASNIFKPALARGKMRLIGATTTLEYKNTIEKDKALNRRFQNILISEPNLEETQNILLKIKSFYEDYHNVVIPSKIILSIITYANQYIFNRKNPDKCIDILDEVCARRSLVKDKSTKQLELLKKEYEKINHLKNTFIIKHQFLEATKLKNEELLLEDKINKIVLKTGKIKEKIVTEEDVIKVIESRSNIPIYIQNKKSVNKLKNIEKKLQQIVFGQEEAIHILCQESEKTILGLRTTNKPLCFLFLGSSGVGKTFLAKEYARLFSRNLIRIDASEYTESHSISKIIGAPPGYVGYDINNIIVDEIKNNPYSVLLIDEIEKACQAFHNLFLQILDEGFITNSNLEKIYFNHTIIIMTSNINSNINNIGFHKNKEDQRKELEKYFSLELINRFQHIIYFNSLNKDIYKKILQEEIKKITKELNSKGIEINISSKFLSNILNESLSKGENIRDMKKNFENKIDELIINKFLKEKVKE